MSLQRPPGLGKPGVRGADQLGRFGCAPTADNRGHGTCSPPLAPRSPQVRPPPAATSEHSGCRSAADARDGLWRTRRGSAVSSTEIDRVRKRFAGGCRNRSWRSLSGWCCLRGARRSARRCDRERAVESSARERSERVLVSMGVLRSQIAVEGLGARQPIDPAETPEARWRATGRVEVLWKTVRNR